MYKAVEWSGILGFRWNKKGFQSDWSVNVCYHDGRSEAKDKCSASDKNV